MEQVVTHRREEHRVEGSSDRVAHVGGRRLIARTGATRVLPGLLAGPLRIGDDRAVLRVVNMAARAGWPLTTERVVKSPEGLDLSALLDRIESEMGSAAPEVQWTMNFSLAEIGIHFPDYRKRALTIGEALGIYRDYPTSKGCTSPFAPIWINEMVSRQG